MSLALLTGVWFLPFFHRYERHCCDHPWTRLLAFLWTNAPTLGVGGPGEGRVALQLCWTVLVSTVAVPAATLVAAERGRVCAIVTLPSVWCEQTFSLRCSDLGSDKILLHCGFNSQFLNSNRIKHLFTCLLDIGYFFFL